MKMIMLTLLPAWSLCSAVFGQSPAATFTKQQLCAGARGYWGSVESISVSFSSNETNPEEQHAYARSHETVTLKGDKFFADFTFGKDPAIDARLNNRVIAYDGERTTTEFPIDAGCFVQAGRTNEATPHHTGISFFDLCMLSSAGGAAGDSYDSLLALLADGRSSVRPLLEDVDGHWCHVVDLANNGGNGAEATVWIDTDRGYLPVQQVFFDHQTGTHQVMSFKITEAVQLASGHWVPVRGWKQTGAIGSPGLTVAHQWNIEVDHDTQGANAVAVNAPVDDSLFALSAHLPPGFHVLNLDTNERWIAAGGDYERSGKALKPVLANSDLRLRRHGVEMQRVEADLAVPPHRGIALAASGLGGAVLSILGGLTGVAIRRRR